MFSSERLETELINFELSDERIRRVAENEPVIMQIKNEKDFLHTFNTRTSCSRTLPKAAEVT